MYLKLNERGYIVGFSSRPAMNHIGVDRELYNRARVKFTSLQMNRRRGNAPIEIEVEADDLYDSMNLVTTKNFEVLLTMMGSRMGGIKPEHVIYSAEADEAREGFLQINARDYAKKDPIGCALAWSAGKLYNPSTPFVRIEETTTEEEADGTGSIEDGTEPEPQGEKEPTESKPKASTKKRRTKKNAASASGKDAKSPQRKPSNKSEGVQEPKPVTEDPWTEEAEAK